MNVQRPMFFRFGDVLSRRLRPDILLGIERIAVVADPLALGKVADDINVAVRIANRFADMQRVQFFRTSVMKGVRRKRDGLDVGALILQMEWWRRRHGRRRRFGRRRHARRTRNLGMRFRRPNLDGCRFRQFRSRAGFRPPKRILTHRSSFYSRRVVICHDDRIGLRARPIRRKRMIQDVSIERGYLIHDPMALDSPIVAIPLIDRTLSGATTRDSPGQAPAAIITRKRSRKKRRRIGS